MRCDAWGSMKSKICISNSMYESTTCCSSSSSFAPDKKEKEKENEKKKNKKQNGRRSRGKWLVKFVLGRNLRLLLVIPLFYISLWFTWVALFSPSPLPGSVYRTPQLFSNLWPLIQSDNASSSAALELSTLWNYNTIQTHQNHCSHFTPNHTGFLQPTGYLIVEANGGLNQQRSSICNAVAVAWLLNATLVVPEFNFHNIWRDPSEFGDIYDENHFIKTVESYVQVVRKLPEDLMERYNYNMSNITNVGVRGWAPASYYLREVHPLLREQGVIRIAPFANRLAMAVPPNIQFLRCLTNYKALRFSDPIATLAARLVDRMIEKSSRSAGKFVSVHLRFEEDMVAFSCCIYDGGETEKIEMESAREKGWGNKFKRKDYVIRPGLNRISGRCPLTPLEVGMMLRGMGFDNSTSIYLASGKIYQAERNLAPLLKIFPMVETKESLLTPDELASFKGYSSRLAALDYTACLFSEVFVTTQGGNFPHFLIGHRRFLYGHAKTIRPDKRKLVLLMQDTSISWESFKKQMKKMLVESDRQGKMVPRVRKASRHFSVYMYPSQECMCLQGSTNSTMASMQAIGTTTLVNGIKL